MSSKLCTMSDSNSIHFSLNHFFDYNLRSNRVFVFGLSDMVAYTSYTSPSERIYIICMYYICVCREIAGRCFTKEDENLCL